MHTLQKLGTNLDVFGRSFCKFCYSKVLRTNSCEHQCMTHLINGGGRRKGGGGLEIGLSRVSITMCDDLDTFTDIWAQVCMSLVKREREVTLEMTPHTSPKISIDSLPMCFNTNHMTRVSYLHMGYLSTYVCRYGHNQIKLFSSTYTLFVIGCHFDLE